MQIFLSKNSRIKENKVIQKKGVAAMTKKYIKVKQASEYSSIPEGTLYYYIHKGILPHYKVCGRQLLRISELDKFIEVGGVHGQKKAW